jgi:ABC-2 type transport system ATP-binding protein
MTNAIELQAVCKSFGDTKAVRDLNLSIPIGSLCGFLGPNGAGKSTTIRMIMSIIHADEGSVQVLDTTPLTAKDRIGYLPEERGVYRKMKVGAFIKYIANLKGLRGGSLHKSIDDWLDRIDLPNVKKKRCEELSKGMQQKVQFLSAIIHDPELIILDEPFSGLDPLNTQVIGGIIEELHAAGKTILFSTHVLHQAEEVCDRIVMIDKGYKVIDDDIATIRRKFDPRIVQVEPVDETADFSKFAGIRKQNTVDKDGNIDLFLEDNTEPTSVIQEIASTIPVRSIQILKPTLTEIFINQVELNQGNEAAEETRGLLTHA